MSAIVLAAAIIGLQSMAGSTTLALKLREACKQLGISDASLTVPAALQACNEAVGIEQAGPLLAQADVLVEQLGLGFDPSPVQECATAIEPPAVESLPDVHAVMSAPSMVHTFTEEVRVHACKQRLQTA